MIPRSPVTSEQRDARWMEHAITLARQGAGKTDPNPIVGAVIVREDRLLGEGFHERDGGPHAEINAISDALRRGNRIDGATMYVTMEPCSTFGRTGACTSRIIAQRLGRVVIGCIDPHPDHRGNGIAILRTAGVTVTEEVLADRCAAINSAFNARMSTLLQQPPQI